MSPLVYVIALIIISLFLTITTEIECFGWTTIAVLASVASVHLFHLFDIVLYVKQHIAQTILYTLGYIGLGVVWSFAKWFFFLIDSRDKTRKFIESNTAWGKYNIPTINVPQASDNKIRIVCWISYWPFSFVGTILNDPFRKLFTFIFNRFKNLYQRMANSIYKDDIETLKHKVLLVQEDRSKQMQEEYEKKRTQ